MIDLDKILELEAKATQGPWALEIDTAPITLYLDDRFTELDRTEDIGFISAMRNSIKELCHELRAARAVCAALKKARVEEYCNVPGYVDEAMDKLDKVRRG